MSRQWLERWFGDHRKEEVLKMVQEHLELTQNAVKELYNMICEACGTESDKVSLYNKISELEMKADSLRRDMITKLTEREIFPSERQDLMELVRAVDWVADWSREAGRILVIIPFEKAPEEMKATAQNMSKASLDAVSLLAESINELIKDNLKAIELADKVELLEEDVDEFYSEARKNLATLDYSEFSLGELILLNEFLDAIETVADWCENTVDIVRAIAVRVH
jgi:predicted phosphate transport protein (TIGR00153 family)